MKPIDVVFLRDEWLRWLRTPFALDEIRMLRESQEQGVYGLAEDDDEARRREHINRFRLAELYFVNAEMTSLAISASKTLPTFQPSSANLPSDYGLILFDQPIGYDKVAKHPTARAHVVAASWSTHPYRSGGFMKATLYADFRRTVVEAPELEFDMSGYPGPKISRCGNLLLPWGDVAYEDDLDDSFSQLRPSIKAFLTALVLMQQQGVASSRTDALTDKANRALLRRRRIEPEPVRVIRLRHTSNPDGSTSEAQREYHHRWMVRGHWRQQAHGPGRTERKPIWVAPHIKGPDGAPLLTGEKVHAWVR